MIIKWVCNINIIMNFVKFFNIIAENAQKAHKLYVKTNRISDDEWKHILAITKSDYLTKFITEVYLRGDMTLSDLSILHARAKAYDSRIFPIKHLDDFQNVNENQLANVIGSLRLRQEIIKKLSNLPGIIKRNLRNDIREKRDSIDFATLKNNIDYIWTCLGLLDNRDERTKNVVLRKILSSEITSFSELASVIDDKSALIGGNKITKEKVKKLIKYFDNDWDLKLIKEEDKYWIIRVASPEAMKRIGCNALWCFTYGENNEETFYNYSHHDMVYLIIDWTAEQESYQDETFMVVVIKPIPEIPEEESEDGRYGEIAYDMFNEPINIWSHLHRLNIDPTIFTFEDD